MKQCPQCSQRYADKDLNFCLSDGTVLVSVADPASEDTIVVRTPQIQPASEPPPQSVTPIYAYLFVSLLALIVGGGIVFWLTRPGNEVSPASLTKIEKSTPSSTPNQAKTKENPTQPAARQNNPVVVDPPLDSTAETQPSSDYVAKNVRAGTADGQRMRVVVDLTRTNLNTGSAARFETLSAGGLTGEARIFVHAQHDNFLNVKYESKQVRKLGSVVLSPSDRGLEIKVIPQNQLYLRDVFFIPRSTANPHDRLVIDMCPEADCPSLRPPD